MRLFLFLILFCFSNPSLAEPHSSSDQTVLDSAKQAVWKVYDKDFKEMGTGFFIGPNLFITNFHVISNLLEDSKIEDLVLSHDDFPSLRIEKVLALSALHDLALLEIKTEEAIPHLKLRENLSGVNEDLVILGYPDEKWKQMNKTGKFLSSTFKQTSSFPVDHSDLLGASGSPVLDNKGQVVGVVFKASSNISTMTNLAPLKRFVSGEEKQNCNNSSVEECMRKAMNHLKEMAEQGFAPAQYKLANFHFDSEKQDLKQALIWWTKAAEQGYAPAQYHLAFFYWEDEKKDLALIWMRKSAEQGYALAQYSLALFYWIDEKKDQDQALFWWKKSAEQGFAPAQYHLALFYWEDEKKDLALIWMRKSAEQGYAPAQYNLALFYFKDEKKDLEQEALIWMEKSAEQGYAPAQYYLALFYLKNGKEEQALIWWKEAAKQGYAQAQYHLALFYLEHEKKDLEQALFWLKKAAEQGFAPAIQKLEALNLRE